MESTLVKQRPRTIVVAPQIGLSVCAAFAVVLMAVPTTARAQAFDFQHQLFDPPSTLSILITAFDPDTGYVAVNGGDSQCPTIPFSWDWGDGTPVEEAFFPRSHTYADLTQNYMLAVTAHYNDGGTDTKETQARFVDPQIDPVTLPEHLTVTIPDHDVTLISRMPGYYPPGSLTHFDDSFFEMVPRWAVEYVLTAGATVQMDFAGDDVVEVGGGFQQVALRDPTAMYSLWFTEPVAFAGADWAFTGSIAYSSCLHELGHNCTLNFPADYCYGGKIDGCANAIYSETMAQVFQHATAYELINHAAEYGLGEDVVHDLTWSAIASIEIVRRGYDDYVNGGSVFCSWNHPSTPVDETFNTFMTIAYKFCAQAELAGHGYRCPLKRMMELLALFDDDLRQQYDQYHDTPEAAAFRATLMVAAMSHGFSTDLRADFAELNFPIDDATYEELITAAQCATAFHDLTGDFAVDLADLGQLLSSYGMTSGAAYADGDLDCDDDVDLADLATLLSVYGTTCQ